MYEKITERDVSLGRKALLDGWGGRPNFVIAKAKGAKLWDTEGKEYIDCTSQAFTINVGALHPKVVEAVKEQLERASQIVYQFDSIPLLLLSKKLAEIAPGNLNKVDFCLEGSLAVEAAMKIAMKNRPGKKYFITLEHAYHGRSLATMAASWVHPQNPFPYYMENIVRVPEAYCYRCAFGLKYPSCNLRCAQYLEDTIKGRVNGGVIAVMMEPVQGNGGQIAFPSEYHKKIREICTNQDVLLIWDEIQTGFGRTGEMFAANLYNVVPDILIFGKAAAGGFPLAGIIVCEELKNFGPGEHAFCFAHFPISLVAALATIKIIEEENLLQRCKDLNKYITDRLMKMKEEYEIIGDIRGPGFAIGIELVKNKESKKPAVSEANKIVKKGLEKGVIFGISKYGNMGNVIKIKPSLTITDAEIEKALSVFETCVYEVDKNRLSALF